MRSALCELLIVGIDTNIEEQLRLLNDPRFLSGDYDTTLLEVTP